MTTLKVKCIIEGVAEQMPIVPASAVKIDWFEKAKEYYTSLNDDTVVKTTTCPGIIGVQKTGWIQKTYQDIIIQTNGDGKNFQWITPFNQREADSGHFIGNYVDYHPPQQLSKFYNIGKDTLQTLVKIQSPWFVEIPKGYSLLLLPLPYQDDRRFTAAPGILRKSNFLNAQLYWHCINSVELIPAGTPLHQMFLIKNESVKMDIEQITDYKTIDEYLKEHLFYYDKLYKGEAPYE